MIYAVHVFERDGVFRQQDIPIPKVTKGIECRALMALFMEQHCGRHLLRFLRGHNKNHRAKDNGQCHRQQYISIVYHHGAKVHFFRPCSVIFHKSIINASCSCVSPTCCPCALSAHPTLRPNGLMWGYWNIVPLACSDSYFSKHSNASIMSRHTSSKLATRMDLPPLNTILIYYHVIRSTWNLLSCLIR